MAKTLARKAAVGAAEQTLQSLMPQLFGRLDSIQLDIRRMDAKVDQLRQDMYDKFEQNRDLINDMSQRIKDVEIRLGERIARVEGHLEVFVRTVNRQSDKMDGWIDRLVRLEMTHDLKRKKRAG